MGKDVVFVGEEPTTSAPSLTLSKALTRLGVPIRFVSVDKLRRWGWVRSLASVKAIVLVAYGWIDAYRLSQLATAAALGVPIVRWWVGTDVLNVITSDEIRKNASRLDSIVSANVAVAPHLVGELATAGICARFIPSVLDPDLAGAAVTQWNDQIRPVLVYMPTRRKDFFGISVIESVIAANPDIKFIIVADDSHALATYPNVESLGWVADMKSVYPRAGCVLRITAHDGLPRMLMEALLRGLYAIYSWPLDGCWQARTEAEIQAALSHYRQMTTPNVTGRNATLAMLAERPDRKMSEIISYTSTRLAMRERGVALALWGKFVGV